MKKFIQKARKLLSILGTPYYLRALMQSGTAASIENTSFLKLCSPDLIVDVGANRGQFSLAARRWHQGAQIIAFEPLAAPASKYVLLFSRDTRVRLHRVALSATRGEVSMHVSRRDDSSSLLNISDLQSTYFPGTDEVCCENVESAPLTDFVSEVDLKNRNLLKIDVQGAELEVLRSALPILHRFEWIYVEASFLPFYQSQPLVHELVKFLDTQNFVLTGVFNLSQAKGTGLPLQADFLFTKSAGL